MSLSWLNQPSLVATNGIATLLGLPMAEALIAGDSLSLGTIKALNIAIFGLNVFAVGQPGRIDSPENLEECEDKKKDDESPSLRDYLSGNSLVAPSPWAFAIWGFIYLGEFIFVVSSTAFVQENGPEEILYRKVSGSFMVAQVFQILWTASFRPKYKGNLIFISASMLAGIAYSLNRAHAQFAATDVGVRDFVLYFLPLSLHFGWTTAASLVNLNGGLAMLKQVPLVITTSVGHLSAVLATVLGVYVTTHRRAPVFGCVIAWALTACATGMGKRIQQGAKGKSNSQLMTAQRRQRWLCFVGACLSAGAAGFLALGY
eukprot:CAMPEP_0172465820 /NCGR_PEP_ID=MMETSP1065-20121228/54626_1 /TAXON_ID=265537 /ORGANISM="Amphiprora paludosa, Strain CCMP125" /LENGTH=315 /DNA_ID=CAMNT_0013222465 /DNA_START=92 /DNA_END=1039 /DNA_ORIENTATION=+